MANNDYITTDCKLTVSKNTAKLDEEIFLYKNDKNIKLLIEIVDNKYRYKSDDLSNLLVKYKASYAQVKWYKNAEVKKEFPIQATDDGKVVFVIEGQLIDEDTELGDYDLQLRLLNESQESIRSLPIIKGAVHILKPLFEEGDIATVNSAVADVSMLSLDGDAIDTYNSDGTYNQTNWGNGDVISSAKLNKLEKVAKDNVDKVNKMPAKSIVEGGKIYLTKEDGTKLDSGTELPVGGSTIEVVNNLESDSTTAALSAAQGKALNTQYKDIANKTIIEDNKIYLAKNDGTKIDSGTKLPSSNISNEQLKSIMRELIADGTLKGLSTDSYSSWLAIGDSITVGFNNNNISYADIISKKYGIYLDKDAITGSNMSSDQTQFGNGFYKRIDNDKNDYNLITVMGGLNDFSHATLPLGTFNANIKTTDEPTSFYDGIVILCKKLVKKYPKSKIVFLSSNRDDTYNNKNAESYEQFMEAIDTVCSYFSIPFYRIDDLCGFNRDVYKNQGIDNGDLNNNDIHPKTLGHRKIAGAICDCINFINPVDAWGKGTLNITQLSSIIPKDATISDIKKALTVKISYNNGVEFEITNYDVDGNITEGTSTFTIGYRGVTATTTFKTGEASGAGITPSFQLTSPISVDSTTKKVDIGVNPFSEAKATTIKCKFNATLNDNSVGVGLLRCHGTNVNNVLGIAVNAVGLNTNRVSIIYGTVSQVIYNSSTNDYLEFGVDTELFLVWDGATTISIYNVDSNGIKWSKIITNVTIKTGEGSFYFGNNDTNRYFTGILTTFNVYDTAFTEQDVLNNI